MMIDNSVCVAVIAFTCLSLVHGGYAEEQKTPSSVKKEQTDAPVLLTPEITHTQTEGPHHISGFLKHANGFSIQYTMNPPRKPGSPQVDIPFVNLAKMSPEEDLERRLPFTLNGIKFDIALRKDKRLLVSLPNQEINFTAYSHNAASVLESALIIASHVDTNHVSDTGHRRSVDLSSERFLIEEQVKQIDEVFEKLRKNMDAVIPNSKTSCIYYGDAHNRRLVVTQMLEEIERKVQHLDLNAETRVLIKNKKQEIIDQLTKAENMLMNMCAKKGSFEEQRIELRRLYDLRDRQNNVKGKLHDILATIYEDPAFISPNK
ncbi:MAG: hypothetical protein AAGI68_10820 [Planctomycetota bacterium]